MTHLADDLGRETKAMSKPPRVEQLIIMERADRYDGFIGPLSAEVIADAARAAESGDMSAQAALFEEMEENDGSLAGFLQTRRNAPVGLDWSIPPAKVASGSAREKALAQKIAEDTANVVEQIHRLDEYMIDWLDAVGKSISANEIHWRPDGTVEAFTHVNPTSYRFDETNRFGLKRENEFDLLYPPPAKFLIHTSKTRSGHPSRRALLRSVVWPYLFRNYNLKDWSVSNEIYGMPLRLGKWMPGATPADKKALAQAVKDVGTAQSAVIASTTDITFVKSEQSGNAPYPELYREMRSEYAFAILGQEGTNVTNKYGTRGDSDVKQLVRQDILESDCKQLQNTIRRDLLFWIVVFRWGWDNAVKYTPFFKLHYEPEIDRASQIGVDKIVLIDMGLKYHVLRADVAKKYGWELAPEGTKVEDLLADPAEREAMMQGLAGEETDETETDGEENTDVTEKDRDDDEEAERAADSVVLNAAHDIVRQRLGMREVRRAPAPKSDPQHQVDKFVGKVGTKHLDGGFAEIEEYLSRIILDATDYDDARRRLDEAFDDMPQGQLEETLTRAALASRLYGNVVGSADTTPTVAGDDAGSAP